MFTSERICKRAILFICIIMLGFSFADKAFGIDKNLLDDTSLWNDVETYELISNDDFEGLVKYIIDDNSGIAYINLFYNCDKTKTADKENIYLCFEINNSSTTYLITVNCNGATYSDSTELDDNIDVQYNFDNINTKYGTGNLIVAIELKNKDDRTKLNNVSCEFSIADGDNIDIFKELPIDMVPVTTTKEIKTTSPKTTTTRITTEKITTTKITTSKETTTKTTTYKETTTKLTTVKQTTTKLTTAKQTTTKLSNTKQSTSKTAKPYETTIPDYLTDYKLTTSAYIINEIATEEKTTKEKTTKFIPEKYNSSAYTTTKYVPSVIDDTAEIITQPTTQTIPDDEFFTVSTEPEKTTIQVKSSLGREAKISIGAAGAAFAIGVFLIIYPLFKKSEDN